VVLVSFFRRGFPPGGTTTIMMLGGWGVWFFLVCACGFHDGARKKRGELAH
jgi:hypothetical protein